MSRLFSSIPLVSMSIFMLELHYFDYSSPSLSWTFQVALMVRNPPATAGRHKRFRFDPWVGKIPWRWESQPSPVFLPGESHRQRSLVGYSPWDHKELDTTERLTHTHMFVPYSMLFYSVSNDESDLSKKKYSS